MVVNNLQTFVSIVTAKFNHCFSSSNDGGSPHENGSFIFVAEMELQVMKSKDWDFIE